MIDFWMAAGLLLLVALSFLLIPVLRGRRAQSEEDRTALNVALYQERIAELQAQQEEGVLSAAQLDGGRAEAARELLADTEGAGAERVSRLGNYRCSRRFWCRCWRWACICISARRTRSSWRGSSPSPRARWRR
jgi:cytochrome c-type biogenesis protein CcmI